MVNMLDLMGYIPQGWITDVLPAFSNLMLYALTPRFVMNIRELYAVDVQGRCDIDTGFGLSSGAGQRAGGTATIGTIAFAEGGEIGGSDDGEEIAAAEESSNRSSIILPYVRP